jgi:sialate O-acetylesterase
MQRTIFLVSALMLVNLFSHAQLRLPSVISSGMVLQQNDSVSLWGWGGPSEKVSVTTSWNNKTYTTNVNNRANWKIRIKTPVAGGPYTITLKADSTILLNDVLIGEVWVCSGQSNMDYSYVNGLEDVSIQK